MSRPSAAGRTATRPTGFVAARAGRAGCALLALGAALSGACYRTPGGDPPNDRDLYFPVGLAITPSAKFLIVANSDFDLRYNAGTVQAFDLAEIERRTRDCESGPTARCDGDAPAALVRASVRIGAFASDVALAPRFDPSGKLAGGRALVPVRGDATLTFVDFSENESSSEITLDCYPGAKQGDFGHTCAATSRVGNDPRESPRGIALEGEPYAVATPGIWPSDPSSGVRRSGGIAAVIHQTSGNVSTFIHVNDGMPRLVYTLGGLPPNATAIAPLDLGDEPQFTPRFLVTTRSAASVSVVSFFADAGTIDRSAMTIVENVPIPTNSPGYDSRGIVVDPPNPGETRNTRVFLTSRTPPSLVIGEVDPTSKRLHFFDNLPLPIGPSRIARAALAGKDAAGATQVRSRILVSSFDSSAVVTYDPDAHRVGNVIPVGRGPYAIAVDKKRKLAFVANFTDSSIQVIELDPAVRLDPKLKGRELFEQVVYTIGGPTRPGS